MVESFYDQGGREEAAAPVRSCGECRVCCKVTSVPGLTKAGKWCKFVTPHGCSIHESEEYPEPCRAFQCGWLLGFGEDRDRPDRSKVMLAANGGKFMVFETTPGSSGSGRAKRIVDLVLYTGKPVVVLSPTGLRTELRLES